MRRLLLALALLFSGPAWGQGLLPTSVPGCPLVGPCTYTGEVTFSAASAPAINVTTPGGTSINAAGGITAQSLTISGAGGFISNQGGTLGTAANWQVSRLQTTNAFAIQLGAATNNSIATSATDGTIQFGTTGHGYDFLVVGNLIGTTTDFVYATGNAANGNQWAKISTGGNANETNNYVDFRIDCAGTGIVSGRACQIQFDLATLGNVLVLQSQSRTAMNNYITLTGAPNGTGPIVGATAGGGDTNVDLQLQTVGSGTLRINGTAGVSCPANTVTLLTEVVTNGIVTHC